MENKTEEKVENKNAKDTWIWMVAIVIIIAIVLFFILKNNKIEPNEQSALPPVVDNGLVTEPESTLDVSDVTPGVAPSLIAYADALKTYADRRIQINGQCQASFIGHTVTYKDNTGIMIDNRSSQAHTLKVGTTFTIKAWGFKIVVLPDIYLKAKTILVDCDKLQNVATILVQE